MRSITVAISAATCILCGLAGEVRAADPHPNGLVCRQYSSPSRIDRAALPS